MRFLITGIAALHSLVHLGGFVKAFNIAEVPYINVHIFKGEGLVWLLACMLLLASSFLFVAGVPWWWAVEFAGLLTSQSLMVLNWMDARRGTLVNMVLAILTVLFIFSAGAGSK